MAAQLEQAPPTAVTGARFPALDGYRALAALMVVVTHVGFATGYVTTGGPLGALASRMDFGVTLFFLLSGFLLYRPWVTASLDGSKPSVLTYAKRRAVRVWPAYLVALVIIFSLLPQAGSPPPKVWAVNAIFGQIYADGYLVEGFTQTWSLATEVSFYLALPFLGALALRLGRRIPQPSGPVLAHVLVLGVMSTIAIGTVLMQAFGPWKSATLLGFCLPRFLDWFAIGMAMSLVAELGQRGSSTSVVRRVRQLADEQFTCLICGAIIMVVMSTTLTGPRSFGAVEDWAMLIRHLGYGLAGTFLLLPAVCSSRPGIVQRAMTHSIPRAVGEVSYGVFLWHLAVMWAVFNVLDVSPFSGGFWWILPTTVALTLMVAWTSWTLLERPLIRWVHGQPPSWPRLASLPANAIGKARELLAGLRSR